MVKKSYFLRVKTPEKLKQVLFLEQKHAKCGYQQGNEQYNPESELVVFQIIGHVHSVQTGDYRGDHQDDGNGGQSFNNDVQIV